MEKRVRCCNFSVKETEILVGLVEQYRNKIECKLTDHVSNNEKDRTWEMLSTAFNAISGTGRSAKAMRSKWDSLKKSTRKEYSNIKNSIYKTGGGPPTDIKLSIIATKILSIIGVSVTGTSCEFDSDFYVLGTENEASCTQLAQPNSACETVENEVPMQDMELMSSPWSKWNPVVLKKPIDDRLIVTDDITNEEIPLVSSNCLSNNGRTGTSISSTTIQTATLSNITEPSTSVQNGKVPYRPKRKAGKQLTNNVESYPVLIKKKIELIDLQLKLIKEEHLQKEKRAAEKHDLEMEILKAQLAQLKD